MIDPKLKRHIKLLAEKFEHEIAYDKEKIILYNYKNRVVIDSNSKEMIGIVYNTTETTEEVLQIECSLIYDWLIRFFERDETCRIENRKGTLLELTDFISEEQIAKKTISELKHQLISSEPEYMDLGGNRFEAEFYKGILILKDDINRKLANVMDININEL